MIDSKNELIGLFQTNITILHDQTLFLPNAVHHFAYSRIILQKC